MKEELTIGELAQRSGVATSARLSRAWTSRIDERIAELERLRAASPSASVAAACRSTAAGSRTPAIAPPAATLGPGTGWATRDRSA